MQALQVIELFAGLDANGQAVIERMPVKISEEDDSCQLVKSPAFVKGIASGDTIKLRPGSQDFELIKRSGNLCIRVLSRGEIASLAESLAPELEKLGGELDTETERMLVFSIHVSCGFQAIEALLNKHVDGQSSIWLYGNVYDPKDGETPLNWWQSILEEK
ncbi:DUF4265 domain-containing protein [Pseudoteredinibacter isoporae]|uniref:Ribosome-interacting GTPase 1 n=1 Tax=Pseudoteredinibacter isoporae TaxID=570281 RepID=A0A7X0JQC9_9GAMM|nr:DUF4265 domain-containing protein [Pseudoteredinibacter isoporae]MBB6520295.1 ribosome-interacting GTPase 1 [Pseudoteredinibacter isoporae]NHO85866.1 DUF4265 domain-containing protein [Pseudoteredinibacter isoporae]NIB25682.1 DUF4265 domain-containing protein [Pseudoteredinibacter isoporae]